MRWKNKTLKKNAKKTIKSNYINIIIVCFIISLLAAGYSSPTINFKIDDNSYDYFHLPTMTENIENTIENIITERSGNTTVMIDNGIKTAENKIDDQITKLQQKFNLKNAKEGAIATLINNTNGSKSFLVGIINTVNKFAFDGTILEGTVMALSSVVLFMLWLFVQNILLVGECRFFLETKNYSKSDPSVLLFVYRVKKTFHVAGIMFFRFLYNSLWYLTIVGGFIKYYSYLMIPYVLAENPNVSRKEAFQISRTMMRGNKWKAFLLDLSFIGWHFISILTLGFARFVYVNPLLSATRSELYYQLRSDIKIKAPVLAEKLNDTYLLNPPSDAKTYPTELYSIPEAPRSKLIKLNYDRDYSFSSIVLLFFTACIIGWVWEVFLFLFKIGSFVNRGTLQGPWLPIYGIGSVLIILLLKPLIKRPILFFPSAFLLCGALEYLTSFILEKLFKSYWWDYSNMYFNVNGRICLEGLLFFAAGCGLVVYVIAPLIDDIAINIPKKAKTSICIVLILLFATDVIYSSNRPNQGEGHIDSSGEMITSEVYIKGA